MRLSVSVHSAPSACRWSAASMPGWLAPWFISTSAASWVPSPLAAWLGLGLGIATFTAGARARAEGQGELQPSISTFRLGLGLA